MGVTQNMGENHIAGQIAQLSAELAASRNSTRAAISGIIECMVAAAEPLITGLFKDATATLQEQLLFTLVLAGACSTLSRNSSTHLGLQIEISPNTLSEAFQTYKSITGKDITPHLPEGMTNFAKTKQLMN